MEFLKLLNTNEIVVQILSFLLLFFLLRAFAWNRLLKLLDARRERIASEFKRIEDEKAAIEKIKGEYNDRLKSIEEAARAKLSEAVIDAEKLRGELKEDARQEAQKIIDSARLQTEYEFKKAKEQLESEITELVLTATERLLEEKITREKDASLVKEFLKELG